MNRFYLVLIVIISSWGIINCTKKTPGLKDLKEQFQHGNFSNASNIIEEIRLSNKSENLPVELEITEAKIQGIKLDFSKTEAQIKAELAPFFPNLTDEQLRMWEYEKSLEMRVINGEPRYFKNAVRNLFRINPAAKKIRETKLGIEIDSLDLFCIHHTGMLVHDANAGKDLLNNPQIYNIQFTITLDADVVPANETVKCWMPFPRQSLPRQRNVKFISANTEKYIIANNQNLQRSIFMEKKSTKGESTVFQYIAQFEIAPQYFHLQSENISPYNANDSIYINYTSERPPHIVFSEDIKKLTDEITSGIDNPFEKTKAIFYWIDKNIPWASALEYSTIECIPEYVLQNRHGDCGMKTLLFMSMARYTGIPCKWQSGWMLHPGELNLHDWCEVYYEGIGWVPVDQSFGLQNSENTQIKEFYLLGIDEYRLIFNDDFSCEFEPKKQFYRSEPVDFQRGELEWKGGNLYFDKWDYHVDITRLN